MYESYFGFTSQPFQLNPDPAFFFNSRGHGRALSYLEYGVAQGEGFIVITGEIGAGKTTLVRTLLDGLDRQKVLPAQVVSTQLQAGELLQSIITGFGIPAQGSSKAHLIATLEAFLTALAAQGRHALLIVDEAQNLEPMVIEELRMLSNFQLGNKALLQSFLVGQPQLRRILESPDMEQLRQRVTASYHLGPLSNDETRGYIEHRLRHVGWDGSRPRFEERAFDHLYRWTGGVPRRLNRLCNRVLLAAFLDGRDEITAELVERAAQELLSEIGEGDFEPLPLPVRAVVEVLPVPEAEVHVASAEAVVSVTTPVQVLAPAEVDAEPAAPVLLETLSETAPLVEQLLEPAVTSTELISTAPDEMPEADDATLAGDASDAEFDDGPLIDEVVDSLSRATAAVQLTHQEVERVETLFMTKRRREVILCVAETESDALKFAVLAKAMAEEPEAPRLVLVNPGVKADVWPWPRMDRLLPSIEVGLHLGIAPGSFEQAAPAVFERFGHVVDEFQPVAVMTMGCGEAVLASALLARKRGISLVRGDAGVRRADAGHELDANAALIEQLSDQLLVTSSPAALSVVRRLGVAGERIHSFEGDLRVDALWAVWREVSTAYGAFLRHAMPIYLGPTWSEHAGAGTPYGLITLSLGAQSPAEAARTVADLLACASGLASAAQAKGTVVPKLLWLVDSRTQDLLSTLLPTHEEFAHQICMVLGEGPRSPALRAKMDQSLMLCREVESLPDQLSILQGASWMLVEPGQILADAAELLEVPTLIRRGDQVAVLSTASQPTGAAYPLGEPCAELQAWMERAMEQARREQPPEAGRVAAAMQARLRQMLARSPALSDKPAPVSQPAADELVAQ